MRTRTTPPETRRGPPLSLPRLSSSPRTTPRAAPRRGRAGRLAARVERPRTPSRTPSNGPRTGVRLVRPRAGPGGAVFGLWFRRGSDPGTQARGSNSPAQGRLGGLWFVRAAARGARRRRLGSEEGSHAVPRLPQGGPAGLAAGRSRSRGQHRAPVRRGARPAGRERDVRGGRSGGGGPGVGPRGVRVQGRTRKGAPPRTPPCPADAAPDCFSETAGHAPIIARPPPRAAGGVGGRSGGGEEGEAGRGADGSVKGIQGDGALRRQDQARAETGWGARAEGFAPRPACCPVPCAALRTLRRRF